MAAGAFLSAGEPPASPPPAPVPGPARLGPRHGPSGFHSRFDFAGGSFSAYIAETRQRIAAARAAAGWQAGAEAVEMATPFEASPEAPGVLTGGNWHPQPAPGPARASGGRSALGVLLVHGLTDSPFVMRDLARYFVEGRGALARAILLPGHGTVPGDLLDADHREWLRAVRYGIESFRGRVSRLLVVGFSAGAALALLAALEGAPVDGVLLFSPAIEVSPLARLVILHRLVSWARPEAAWHHLHADRDPAKYESFSKQAVTEVSRLTRNLKVALSREPLSAPLFIAQSAWDDTVHPAAVARCFAAQPDPRNRMVWFGDGAGAVEAPTDSRVTRMLLPPGGLEDPAGQIVGISHGSIPVHPANPHYGRNGGHRDCLHYLKTGNPDAARRCLDDAVFAADLQAVWGERKQQAPRRLLRRLSFNPYFEQMTAAMDAFLDGALDKSG